MWRFKLYRWWKARRGNGFWIRMPHWADLPLLPLFPWRFVSYKERWPMEPQTYRKHGILVEEYQ